MEAPFYVVFAGVNGAGKSTFFRSDYWRTPEMPERMIRVNPDEILKEIGGDWRSAADNLKAGRIALQRTEDCFAKKLSLNAETTLAGRVALSNIKRAHALGYRVFVYYIGLDSPQTAVARIKHRVLVGGHDIDAQTVMRRYRTSISSFAKALNYCDQALVYDNTVDFSCLAMWFHGTLAWWGGSSMVDAPSANWLANAMVDDEIWQR